MNTTVKTSGVTTTEPVDDEPTPQGLQPFLHEACVTLWAPSFAVSQPDGQLRRDADGFYHGDRRALSRLAVSVDGVPVAFLRGGVIGADRAAFRATVRGLGEHSPDPAVTLERRRRTTPGRLEESLVVVNAGGQHVRLRLTVAAATDLASMEQVKSGSPTRTVPAGADEQALVWSGEGLEVRLTSSTVPDELDAGTGRFAFTVELGPGARWETLLVCAVEDVRGDQFPPAAPGSAPWRTPELRSADRRFDHWLEQSDSDLQRLLLTDPQDTRDRFLAAGAPWFLTLFGRDSLWAARMLLPLGTELAAGTLRTLARRQGTVVDCDSEEQPGKILHEVRRDGLGAVGDLVLPPLYFGTVDATPLWVTLLHDAWRWGMDEEQVEQLLPHAERALAWMADHGDADGDGFLEYIDQTGRGLANQGWKDSGDSIRHQDGRLADSPIALCEVQAYAYEAARGGAALLRAFGRPCSDRWDMWADRLSSRFREKFWVEDAQGPYPAVALDRDKRPVDSVTSGFGHLLGTGLLSREESELLAARLSGPALDSGFGLRTLSTDAVGFNPLGYHVGSIWPHDTAIAIHGLARAGFPEAAGSLVEGLVTAASAFDSRLPELFAGDGAAVDRRPGPYPAACRPQAWAAASSVLLLQSVLGLSADVPGGTLTVAPRLSEAYRPLSVSGFSVAGRPLEIAVDADGTPRVEAPEGITVRYA